MIPRGYVDISHDIQAKKSSHYIQAIQNQPSCPPVLFAEFVAAVFLPAILLLALLV